MRKSFTAIVFAACAALVCAATANAQDPSADEIVRSLSYPPATGDLRGVRRIGPSSEAPIAPSNTAPAGVPTATAATSAVPPTRPPVVNLMVQFATGSAELTPRATQTLDELGRALTSNALSGYRFRIEGHTDTVGTREYNRILSELRAAKVLDYLVTKWSVTRSKVETVGIGQDQPLVPTGPNVPEVRNRRVAVINLGA